MRGALAFHSLKLLARVLLFLLIAGTVITIHLVRETGSPKYAEKIREKIEKRFAAKEAVVQGLKAEKGEFYIARMALLGGEETFFQELEVRSLNCDFSILNQFRKQYSPGEIKISMVKIGLRAGADSEESAKAIGEVLFHDSGKVKIGSVVVNDFTGRWGYSERTRGSIEGSKMTALRVEGGWKVSFKGGTFTQNWLKGLEIVNMEAYLTPAGIVFENVELKSGGGFVRFEDVRVKSGQRPEVGGRVKLRRIDLATLLPISAREFVEGSISADLDVFGSTNAVDGIGFEGKVVVDGEDSLVLRDRLHLLRALSVIDAFNTYRRIDFTKGSFQMKTHGGRMEVTDVELDAGGLMAMKGGMSVRSPTTKEQAELDLDVSFQRELELLGSGELGQGVSISLEDAASEGDKETGRKDDSLFEKFGLSSEERAIEAKSNAKLSGSYIYDGKFEMSLPKDVFLRSPKLAEAHPVDEVTGRVEIEVPVEGVLYELTAKQSDEIYRLGAR